MQAAAQDKQAQDLREQQARLLDLIHENREGMDQLALQQQALSEREAEVDGMRARLEQELSSLGGADLAGKLAALEKAEVRSWCTHMGAISCIISNNLALLQLIGTLPIRHCCCASSSAPFIMHSVPSAPCASSGPHASNIMIVIGTSCSSAFLFLCVRVALLIHIAPRYDQHAWYWTILPRLYAQILCESEQKQQEEEPLPGTLALLASERKQAEEQQALLEEAEAALSAQRKEAADKEEELAVREGEQ
eukprot:1159052-Pelagomonas_calceolata.AAC.10